MGRQIQNSVAKEGLAVGWWGCSHWVDHNYMAGIPVPAHFLPKRVAVIFAAAAAAAAELDEARARL